MKAIYKIKNRYLKSVGRFLNFLSGGLIFKLLGIKKSVAVQRLLSEEEKQKKLAEIIKEAKRPLPTETELKRVEIIVLKYKDPEVEVKCAQLLIENTDWPFKLNFYDNRPGVKNFSKIWNQLIKESVCDYVLILDSDAFVPKLSPCWLTRLMDTFKIDDCSVVVPLVTRTSCDKQRSDKAQNKDPERLNQIFAAQCVLYKKEVFEKVGYFDEDFLFYGQDSEWAHRAIKLNCGVYLQHDVLIEHHGHYSMKKAADNLEYDRHLEAEYAQRIFRQKTNSENRII